MPNVLRRKRETEIGWRYCTRHARWYYLTCIRCLMEGKARMVRVTMQMKVEHEAYVVKGNGHCR